MSEDRFTVMVTCLPSTSSILDPLPPSCPCSVTKCAFLH